MLDLFVAFLLLFEVSALETVQFGVHIHAYIRINQIHHGESAAVQDGCLGGVRTVHLSLLIVQSWRENVL